MKDELRPTEPGDPSLPIGVYRDLQGRFYQLLGLGGHTETGEVVAVLVALYPPKSHAIVLVPLAIFEAERPVEGVGVPAYEYVGSSVPEALLGSDSLTNSPDATA